MTADDLLLMKMTVPFWKARQTQSELVHSPRMYEEFDFIGLSSMHHATPQPWSATCPCPALDAMKNLGDSVVSRSLKVMSEFEMLWKSSMIKAPV
jgi:hypothetical protein